MTDLERIRHSCAHVLATAILRLWPDAQFAYGPPVENGFYYDVELAHRIAPEDFAAIEAEMQMVGFTDASGKKIDFYWRNSDLTPDVRPKGGVK